MALLNVLQECDLSNAADVAAKLIEEEVGWSDKSPEFWGHGSNDLCETCNSGGDLLSCSYCNVSYHNEAPCLDESQVIAASLKNSRSYEWPSPNCFKDAVRAHQRMKKLAPKTTTGASKKKRKARRG